MQFIFPPLTYRTHALDLPPPKDKYILTKELTHTTRLNVIFCIVEGMVNQMRTYFSFESFQENYLKTNLITQLTLKQFKMFGIFQFSLKKQFTKKIYF